MPVTKEIVKIASAAMPFDEQWAIRRTRYNSGLPGGRLCIAAGTHGDEMMGQLVCFQVADGIQREPEHLRGIVDIYPMLNPLGLDIMERMVPVGTRLDMNLAFPGNPEGTPLEILCHAIMQDMLGADLVLDVRFLPNPFYIDELKPLSGLDQEVYDYVMGQPDSGEYMQKLTAFLDFQLPRFRQEGKPSLTVAVGCTGGRHRSITIARALTNYLVEHGQNARLICRDLGKEGDYV